MMRTPPIVSLILTTLMFATAGLGSPADRSKPAKFHDVFSMVAASRKSTANALCDDTDPLSRRILWDYGAIFVATEEVLTPPVCIFESAASVDKFQNRTKIVSEQLSGARIELQAAAMHALLAARAEARKLGSDITPRDGVEAARRSFDDTVRLWDSRFLPALRHWQELGKLSLNETEFLRSLSTRGQVEAVLEYEKRGLFFSRGFARSILYSVAAPGTSQHLSLLAFDANEYADIRVRRILSSHGWFRTVKGDGAHFTFLGFEEGALPTRGLRKILTDSGEYWIPNV